MPDIRDIISALDEDDRKAYIKCRTRMRTAYMKAVIEIAGIELYDESDDQILDWIDIKIGHVFDRAGRFDASKGTLADTSAVEKQIEEDGKRAVSRGIALLQSYAGDKKPVEGW